jgi:hypothetical protein
LTFPDPEISSSIETEIFATNPDFQFIRSGGSVAKSGYTSKGSSEKELEYLSVMERLVYNQAITVGDKSTIDRLNKKIKIPRGCNPFRWGIFGSPNRWCCKIGR